MQTHSSMKLNLCILISFLALTLMIVHHDDAKREWAYDRESHIGRLVRGLDEGPQRGWKIISMKNDWNLIYP